MSMELYAEEIVAHYEHPHNKGVIANASASHHGYNPLCGDDITIYLEIEDGKVADAKFDGVGCAISIGTASMLTDHLKGKTLAEINKMGIPTITDLLGIDPGPVRLKCATLSLKAAQSALKGYRK